MKEFIGWLEQSFVYIVTIAGVGILAVVAMRLLA